jgi:hypothetical protein
VFCVLGCGAAVGDSLLGLPNGLPDGDSIFSFSMQVVTYRGDATNGGCFRGDKLHATSIETAHFIGSDLLSAKGVVLQGDWWKRVFVRSRPILCDVLRAHGGTASDLTALVEKQLKSVGCPSPLSCCRADSPDGDTLTLFLYTSDGGPDERLYKKIMQFEALHKSHIIFETAECVKHKTHLAGGDGLKLVDQFLSETGRAYTYFGTLAKMSNCRRYRSEDVWDP